MSDDEDDLRGLVRGSRLPMLLFRLVEGEILEASDPLIALFAASQEAMVGRQVVDFVIGEAGMRARWALMAAGELDGYQLTGRACRRLDGSTLTVDVSVNSCGGAEPRRYAVAKLAPPHVVDRTWELERVLQQIAREIEATGVLAGSWGPTASPRVPALAGLSTRELEIVRRLLVGDRVPMIAQQLFLSESTVRNHLTSVYRKLGVRSQQQLLSLLRAEQLR